MARLKAKMKPSKASEQWPADTIERRSVAELVSYPDNPRLHSESQVEEISNSMQEWGWTVPVLIDEENGIIAGHGRVMAARKLGIIDVPVMVARGWSSAQKRAYVIADNQIPQSATWDNKLLRMHFTQLAKVDYPLQLTGFDNVHLATFIGGRNGDSAPNDVPELAPAISKPGETWLMGKHRIVCGDSSNEKTVAKLFGTVEPKVMVTDPPYNAETSGRGIYANMKHTAKMKRDVVDEFEVEQLCALRDTNVIFTSKELLPDYLDLARAKKLTWDVAVLHRAAAVPNHNNHLMSDLDYIVLMGKIAPKAGLEHADYSKLFSTGHWERPVPWAKPVELISRILRLYTDAGETVFEPYCGSGTTIIAAETLGRVCLAVELNAAYVDLTVRRWQKFAGKPAILQGTKKTFDQIAKERIKAAK